MISQAESPFWIFARTRGEDRQKGVVVVLDALDELILQQVGVECRRCGATRRLGPL